MGTIKTFLLGVGTAYAVYYMTRKRPDGTSILDDLLENPAFYLEKAKGFAMAETVRTVKGQIF
jgi:hypothetical protein